MRKIINTRDVQTRKITRYRQLYLGLLRIFSFSVFCFKLKKIKKRLEEKNKERLSAQSMETDIYIFFTKTTLVLSNTPNTNGFTFERGIHVKI